VSQTRRLAAILAADVAGYSRLIGADEGGTLEGFKKIRAEVFHPTIATHNGRLVKTTGDGMLVEFSSVVDALRCAVEVQQAMPERNTGIEADTRIELRIGINLGDVIVEGDDLYGDGVNIAVRVEALADAGGVFVPIRFMTTCAIGCPLSLRIWVSSRLRTLLDWCGSTGAEPGGICVSARVRGLCFSRLFRATKVTGRLRGEGSNHQFLRSVSSSINRP
jgi:hypothetical protein